MVSAATPNPTPVSAASSTVPRTNSPFAEIGTYATKLIRYRAWQIVQYAGFTISDRDDIEQELTLHVLLNRHHFDPARGQEHTFISRIVKNRASDLIRERRALKRRPSTALISLNMLVRDADGRWTELHQTIPDDIDPVATERADDVAATLHSLDPHLQQAAKTVIDSDSTSDLARNMKRSRSFVERRVIEPLRNEFLRAGFELRKKAKTASVCRQ